MPPKLYICMAPPRSGLTPLTGCLRLLGIEPPDHQPDAGTINALFFQDLGISPLSATPLPKDWRKTDAARTAKRRIEDFLNNLAQADKDYYICDPLICRLLPLWQDALEKTVIISQYVLMVRHPFETALSLAAAENVSISSAHFTWLAFTRAVQNQLKDKQYCVISFDMLLDNPITTLSDMLAIHSSSLFVNHLSLTEYIEPSLKHYFVEDMNQQEKENYEAYDDFYKKLRMRRKTNYADILNDDFSTLSSLVDTLLSAASEKEKQTEEHRSKPDFCSEHFLKGGFDIFSLSTDTEKRKPRHISLNFGQWQKVTLDIDEQFFDESDSFVISSLDWAGMISISSFTFASKSTGQKLHSIQPCCDFFPMKYFGNLVRLPDKNNYSFLATGGAADILVPIPKELPDCPLEVTFWIKASNNKALISELIQSSSLITVPTLKEVYLQHKGKIADKWELYLTEYDNILEKFRRRPINLLEIGVLNGGSLEIWAKYFPNAANIIGCEIDKKCSLLTFEDPRISLIIGDANDDEIRDQFVNMFQHADIIIDDGSHNSQDIVKSFGKYFPLLKDDGLYIIEDMHASYWQICQGGLYYPFSAIQFFKHLIDILNYEHWGIKKEPYKIIEGFFNEYGFEISSYELGKIHSISFMNSLCVIKKQQPENNILGKRFIAGEIEEITTNRKRLHNTESEKHEETQNQWANRDMPPGEELLAKTFET